MVRKQALTEVRGRGGEASATRGSTPAGMGSNGAPGNGAPNGPERRRIGKVVHDERGNGSIEWHPAPPGYQREPLEIIEDQPRTMKSLAPSSSGNSYDWSAARRR